MAKKRYMNESTIRVISALAYFPYPFISLGIVLIGFRTQSSLIRNHGFNGTILSIGYTIGTIFVVPVLFSGSLLVLQNSLNVDSFISMFLSTNIWMNIIFGVYQVYCMVRVYKDVHYIPFFSPFRSLV